MPLFSAPRARRCGRIETLPNQDRVFVSRRSSKPPAPVPVVQAHDCRRAILIEQTLMGTRGARGPRRSTREPVSSIRLKSGGGSLSSTAGRRACVGLYGLSATWQRLPESEPEQPARQSRSSGSVRGGGRSDRRRAGRRAPRASCARRAPSSSRGPRGAPPSRAVRRARRGRRPRRAPRWPSRADRPR